MTKSTGLPGRKGKIKYGERIDRIDKNSELILERLKELNDYGPAEEPQREPGGLVEGIVRYAKVLIVSFGASWQ